MRLEEFLAGQAEKKSFAKGAAIFSQGEQAKAAYYIISGVAEIFRDQDGQKSVLASLTTGEIFGEMALLRFDEYTLSARAIEDTQVYLITPAIMQQQIRSTPPLIKAVLDMLVDRIHETNQVLIDLDNISQ